MLKILNVTRSRALAYVSSLTLNILSTLMSHSHHKRFSIYSFVSYRDKCYKTFYVIIDCRRNKLECLSLTKFSACVMLEGNACASLSISFIHIIHLLYFIGNLLARNYYTTLKICLIDKHSNLFYQSIGGKSFRSSTRDFHARRNIGRRTKGYYYRVRIQNAAFSGKK